MTRIILDFTEDYERLLDQLNFANIAIRDGIKPGQRWGMRKGENTYGIQCNEHSVRVYPQEPQP